MSLDSPRKISHIILMEDIKHGERVRDYVLDYKKAGKWVELVRGSAIGHKKIDRFEPIITDHVRLRVLEAADRPIIREFALI
jgi:alpha-L-fucosidase